jgi:hypothetical protein
MSEKYTIWLHIRYLPASTRLSVMLLSTLLLCAFSSDSRPSFVQISIATKSIGCGRYSTHMLPFLPLKRHTNTQSSSFENAFIMVKCSLSAQMSAGFASSQHTHPSTVLPAHCKTKSLKCGGLVPIAYDCRLREPCVGIQIWELVATHGNRPERSFPSQSSGEGSVDVLGNLA